MTEPVHLDPNRVPSWLMDGAKERSPEAVGWVAAGYLAGVEAGRKSSQCTETAEATLTCGLALGHIGPHATVGHATWSDPPLPALTGSSADLSPPQG